MECEKKDTEDLKIIIFCFVFVFISIRNVFRWKIYISLKQTQKQNKIKSPLKFVCYTTKRRVAELQTECIFVL